MFRTRCRRTVGALALLVAVVAGSLTTASAPQAQAATADPLVFGAHVARVGTQSETQALQAFEQRIGRKLGTVRVFERWNDPFPDEHHDYLKAQGYPIVLSVRAMLANGTHVPWADIAAAPAGSSHHATMVRWARAVKEYGHPVLFSFNQEPELQANLPNGTATDFIAAWQRFVEVFRAEAVTNVRFLWVMTEHAFHLASTDRRSAVKWYPGDTWVDGLAIDVYNWFTCRPGVINPWVALRDLMEPFRVFGAAHPDEVLWLAEWGSAEDPAVTGRKGQWIRAAQELFKQPEYSQLEGISYFNKTYDTADVKCAWSIESSPSAQTAFTDMSNDPFYAASMPSGTAPSAAFTSACTSLSCRFDGRTSSDSDGVVAQWQWSFGDGTTASGAEVSHTYASPGSYTVALSVADDEGRTGSTSRTVLVGAQQVRFVGSAVSNRNALQHTVSVPAEAPAGAGLLLFDTVNSTAVTEGAPAGLTGWTLVSTATSNGLRTRLWQRSLASGEAGRTVSVSVSQYAQVALQLMVYDGTRNGTPVASSAQATETVVQAAHTTPALPATSGGGGGTVVSYWADKSAATTSWTAPAGQAVRGHSAGTSRGHVSHLATDAVTAGATAGGVTAVADSADSRATMWTVELAPSP